MRRCTIPLLLFGLLLSGCPGPVSGPGPKQETASCEELGGLIDLLDRLDQGLASGESWANCRDQLKEAMQLLEKNVDSGGEQCAYLNQRQFPDHARFMFVENLSARIVRDSLADGLYFFVRLRGIFSDDPAISEFFSEELAQVALQNPACYLGYLRANPDQEVMLLYSTRWNYPDVDTLIRRFGRLEGSEVVTGYLAEWKMRFGADID